MAKILTEQSFSLYSNASIYLMPQIKGFLALLSAGATFATCSILIRILSAYVGNLEQASLRMMIAGFIALGIYFFFGKESDFSEIKKRHFSLFTFCFPLSIIFVTLGINFTKVASAIFFLYVGKLFSSILIDMFVFNDGLNKRKITSIILLSIGLVLFLDPVKNGLTINIGAIFGLLGGVIASIDGAYRKTFADKLDRWVMVWPQMFIGGGLTLAALGFYKSANPIPEISLGVFGIMLISCVAMIWSQVAMIYGFKNFDINLGTIVLSSEFVFVIFLAMPFFGEYPTVNELIGAGFIIAAIINRNANLLKIAF